MNRTLKLTTTLIAAAFLVGCMNVGTHPNNISGTYVSDHDYADFTCAALNTELGILEDRAELLYRVQKNRYQGNKGKAFWLGMGDGDGPEAAEYASVLGKIDAIKRAKARKDCDE